MSRVLLDENLPIGMTGRLGAHDVDHVILLGWDGVANGELVAKAEDAGYEVFVTADQSLRYQQNLEDRQLSLVVLNNNQWPAVRGSLDRICEAIERAEPGSFQEISIPRRAR